jgi:hypothetical protein
MTANDYYNRMRRTYKDRYDLEWQHQYMWGAEQDWYLCETAMRSGIECRALCAYSPSEIEMVANAIVIKEMLQKTNGSQQEHEHH